MIHADFIKVQNDYEPEEIEAFGKAVGLDRGESEAIMLSNDIEADLILMDEAEADRLHVR